MPIMIRTYMTTFPRLHASPHIPNFSKMLALALLVPALALAAPLSSSTSSVTAATIGKIRGVRDPIYHLYLQASSKSPSTPILGPEASGDEVKPPTTPTPITKAHVLFLVYNRRHDPIAQNEPIPQHPERDDVVQAAEVGSGGEHDGVGIRGRYDYYCAGE
jgi:hypothetical protein